MLLVKAPFQCVMAASDSLSDPLAKENLRGNVSTSALTRENTESYGPCLPCLHPCLPRDPALPVCLHGVHTTSGHFTKPMRDMPSQGNSFTYPPFAPESSPVFTADSRLRPISYRRLRLAPNPWTMANNQHCNSPLLFLDGGSHVRSRP